MTMVPATFWVVWVFVLGAIFGSFLNVYIYRFHTGKSLNGRSHCLSCGTPLVWFELFPLVSYVGLRGRCRSCGCRITPRYFVVELAAACLVTAAALTAASIVQFGWLSVWLLVLLVITVYDYYHFIIPDELVLALVGLQVGWWGYVWWGGAAPATLLVDIGAGVAGAAFLGALWAVSRGRWLGFGDVKLALPLGWWVGAGSVFSFVVVSFWVGAIVSVLILTWQYYERGKTGLQLSHETLTMKSAIPFAPFLIVGAALVYFFNLNVLELFAAVSIF